MIRTIFYILADGSLKQAESKAECALRRILLYFQPALSGHLFSKLESGYGVMG